MALINSQSASTKGDGQGQERNQPKSTPSTDHVKKNKVDSRRFRTGRGRACHQECNVPCSQRNCCKILIYKRRSQGHFAPSTERRRYFLAFQPLCVRRT